MAGVRSKVVVDVLPKKPEDCPFAKFMGEYTSKHCTPNCALKCVEGYLEEIFSFHGRQSCDIGNEKEGYPGKCLQCVSLNEILGKK